MSIISSISLDQQSAIFNKEEINLIFPNKGDLFTKIHEVNNTIGWGTTDSYIFQRNLSQPDSIAYFLINTNGLVGYAQAKPIDDKNLYLSFIAVKSEEQHNKYGTVLIQQIFDEAIKNKKNVCLDVEGDNDQALAFYNKQPYEKTIKKIGSYGDGTPKIEITFHLIN